MADFTFEDPFDDSLEEIRSSLFNQVEILWPDQEERPDMREGSLLWTLLSPVAFEVQRMQDDLNLALQIGFLQFTFGEFLDLKGIEVGLERKQGSQAEGTLRFLGDIGTSVLSGTTASNIVTNEGDETYYFDTQVSGTLSGVEDPASVDEVQKIIVSGNDRFTLTLENKTTGPISANATGSTVEAAIEALAPTTSYTTINVTGDSGVANSGGTNITFSGGDVADKDIPLLVAAPYQVSETQNISITLPGPPAPYQFTLTFNGQTTATLDENADGDAVVAAINALSPHPTYGAFTVSCTNGPTQVDAPGGVNIVFNGGGVENVDVPMLQVNTISGTFTPTVTEVTKGENSASTITVEEVVKGRNAKPIASTVDRNEVQRLSYTKPEVVVETVTDGSTGLKNQKQRLAFSGSPAAGFFTLTFDDGTNSDTTAYLPHTADAADIETALTALSNILSADNVSVDLVSGGPQLNDGNAVFDVEFKGELRQNTFDLLQFTQDPLDKLRLLPSGTEVVPVITENQAYEATNNEVQVISFVDSIYPDGGTFTLKVEDTAGNSETTAVLPYTATNIQIRDALEALTIFGAANPTYGTSFGANFVVTGGPFNSSDVQIQYSGINRFKNFKPVEISTDFDGTPSSGTYTLSYNSGTSTAAISRTATTQDVEGAINAVNVAADDVNVYVANGIQTIAFTGGLPSNGTQFILTLNDGTTTINTGNILAQATAADVKAAINSADPTANVEVYSSDGNPATALNSALSVSFKIHFTSANQKSYKHLVGANGTTPLDNGASVVVGPTLADLGAAYEIEFQNPGVKAAFTASSSFTFPPVISDYVAGDVGTKCKKLLTLSHPAGLFKLEWGTNSPKTTALISPHYDDATALKHKIEAIADITSDVTVTGGPIYSSPASVTFSGATLQYINWPEFLITSSSVSGGKVNEVEELVRGFGGSGGSVTGTVQYVYSIVTKLGTQNDPNDPDFEFGYGLTGKSEASTPIVVSNNKVSVEIRPILKQPGLLAPKAVKVYRRLTTGFSSSPYKLIETIDESDLKLTQLGTETSVPSMFIEDNVPLSLFNATTEQAPTSNTTGVLDVAAKAQDIGSNQNVGARAVEAQEDIIAGIERVTNPEPFGGGSDVESDDDYRARLIEYIQKDPGAGNIDDYVSWATEISGVSGASVIPEWQEIYGPLEGPGTVKVIVFGENSTILPDSKVEEVRQYICGTVAIPNPDQEFAPAAAVKAGGDIEVGKYEYVYTFINVGKGETEPSARASVILTSGNQTVELGLERGQGGLGVQNTIGRRIYRRKVDGAVSGQPDSEKFVLVAEILNNDDTVYTDTLAFADLPTWRGYPNGPYQRRKVSTTNTTSIYDGQSPIGAHVTVESISEETIWVSATVYPEVGYSLDGSGGTTNISDLIDEAIGTFFSTLQAGKDVKIVDIANVIHDLTGVKDFKDLKLYSPNYPTGTTDNISVSPGVSANYSTAGTFTLWTSYPYDR